MPNTLREFLVEFYNWMVEEGLEIDEADGFGGKCADRFLRKRKKAKRSRCGCIRDRLCCFCGRHVPELQGDIVRKRTRHHLICSSCQE